MQQAPGSLEGNRIRRIARQKEIPCRDAMEWSSNSRRLNHGYVNKGSRKVALLGLTCRVTGKFMHRCCLSRNDERLWLLRPCRLSLKQEREAHSQMSHCFQCSGRSVVKSVSVVGHAGYLAQERQRSCRRHCQDDEKRENKLQQDGGCSQALLLIDTIH